MRPTRMTASWQLFGWVAVVIGSGIIVASSGSFRVAAQGGPDARLKQMNAYRAQGLQAAASISGSFVTSDNYPMVGGPADLTELTDLSVAIVVGLPVENVCLLTSRGRSVATLYTIQVESALKGLAADTKSISVAVLGGRVGFADGTWAQVNVPNFQRPMPYRRLAIFLRRAPASMIGAGDERRVRGELFVPTSGPLGLYDLSETYGPYVAPAGNYLSVLGKVIRQHKLTPDAFLEVVKGAIR